MISLAVVVGEIAGAINLTPEQSDAVDAGALDGDIVWYEYVTQHDDHVRPSHAALDGSVWRVGDPLAPVPPIDWGCRCFLRYVGKPGTVAARVLPEAAAEPLTKAAVYAEHLDDAVPAWREIAKETAQVPVVERAGAIYLALKAKDVADARDVAMMIIEASKAAQ